jgi:hypothetical protein
MIKNGQDLKRHMKFYLNLWLCPFKPGNTSPSSTLKPSGLPPTKDAFEENMKRVHDLKQ